MKTHSSRLVLFAALLACGLLSGCGTPDAKGVRRLEVQVTTRQSGEARREIQPESVQTEPLLVMTLKFAPAAPLATSSGK